MVKKTGFNRRDFLQLMGVGAGAAVISSCKFSTQNTAAPTAATINPLLYQKKTPAAPGGIPDLILRNGKIITVDASDNIAQAVAIKSGRIQAVGTSEEIDVLGDSSTRVMDLGGRVLTPGFIDPHFHLATISMLNNWVGFNYQEVNTIEKMIDKLREEAAGYAEGEWIEAYWEIIIGGEVPDRHDLDRGTSVHPVWLSHRGGHVGVANTLALQLAGITRDTPDPMGGVIERDDKGELTGRFFNHRAMYLLRKAIPPRSAENVLSDVRDGQWVPASAGITTFHDVYVYDPNSIKAYYDVGKAGEMTVRGALYPVLENPSNIDYALNMECYKDDFFRLGGFKLQIDGQVPTAFTYESHEGTWNMPAWEADIYKETIKKLHDAGFQVCVHCFGDAAIDLTLDAFEEAMDANPRSDPRHRIEHYLLGTEKGIQRTRDLGVIASVSSSFIPQAGDAYVATFGEKRCERLLPTRELLDAGALVTLNSDYPTTYWEKPQMNMYGAMQRTSLTGKKISLDQSITFMEALRAHTMGGAYAGFDETDKGSVEPGKMADLAVWTKDPMEMTAEELSTATVDITMVGGEVVFQV